KLGIKFHHAENEWHSYVADNNRLEGMLCRSVLIPFVLHRSASVCPPPPVCLGGLSGRVPRCGCRLFNSYPEGR
ncbi:hypothetical protein, partial [uncultured Bacteroides sp.]|uniref:hypothetical protein n=1 Tax=uncultured Bacteroides sp. TaxID=162156 RepID=UPI0025E7CD1D